MAENETKPIYVVYVASGDANADEIEVIMKKAYAVINPIFEKQGDSEVIFIPVRGTDSRIECINPKYITEGELIRKHRLLIDELHEHLDSHLKEIIENKKKEG